MNRLLIKNAQAVVTVDDQDRVAEDVNLYIEGREIVAIDSVEREVDQVIDASGSFVYPGLINTHHHFYQTFTRNLPQVQNLELFPWLTALYELWRHLDDEAVYLSSLTALGELVKYGCTTSMDHHYVFPRSGSEAFIVAQFKAAEELGVRFMACRGSMSRGKREGGLPPDDIVQELDLILRDSEDLVRSFHDDSRFSMRQLALAPCSPFSVTTELLKETAILARQLGVRLHTHLCETKDEEQFCLDLFGQRPLDYMEDCGWTGRDVWYAHGIHFNTEELDRLANTGTGIAHCPASNMKLSSGVCRVPEILERKIPLGLAVDGSASNDCSNLLAEIRAAYLLHRLTWSSRAPSGYEILKIATRGSAALLGRTDIGYLAPGMAADLFLIDVTGLEAVGADLDPANFLGTVGYAKPAKAVVIDGRLVSENGILAWVDEESLARRAKEKVGEFLVKGSRD